MDSLIANGKGITKLDYLLGNTLSALLNNCLVGAQTHLKTRINTPLRDIAKPKIISLKQEQDMVMCLNFNVGSAVKHICMYTRTGYKRELSKALHYIEMAINTTAQVEVNDE